MTPEQQLWCADRVTQWRSRYHCGSMSEEFTTFLEDNIPNWTWGNPSPWKNVSYLTFEEARTFVKTLNLKTSRDWATYCTSKNRNLNIPTNPHVVFKEQWVNWGNWLGVIKPTLLPFDEARSYVHSLGLKSRKEYIALVARRPDTPSEPQRAYKEQWVNWGDWLGTGYVHCRLRKFLPFEEARTFVQSLGLHGRDGWQSYCKSDRPEDIPSNPQKTYKAEWIDLNDWLGTSWMPFEAARTFVRSLGLKTSTEWTDYCTSGNKPTNIPSTPKGVYKEYAGMGDWLGTGVVAPQLRVYRPFAEARKFVHKLGLTSGAAWRAYKNKPGDIPTDPSVYDEFVGWGDWVGTGFVANQLRVYRPFSEARDFARTLGLRGQREWKTYAKIDKPTDLPANPYQTYKVEWAGWKDWLGK